MITFNEAQLTAWLNDLVHLRLGRSLVSGDEVLDEIAHQFGHTLELSIAAWLMALALGVTLGSAVALARRPWLDRGLQAGAANRGAGRSRDSACAPDAAR